MSKETVTERALVDGRWLVRLTTGEWAEVFLCPLHAEGDAPCPEVIAAFDRSDDRDGGALRLLREAVPDWHGLTIFRSVPRESRAPSLKDVEFTVEIFWATIDGHGEHRGCGATIAEAFDKCREETG